MNIQTERGFYMFKKVMGLALVITLVACGKGKEKGQEKTKTEFDTVAAQRTNVQGAGYKTARMDMRHYQKVEGQSMTQNFYANYTLSGDQWVIGDNNFPATITAYSSMINFTMNKSESFLAAFNQLFSTDHTAKYYIADTTATLDITGKADRTDLKGTCEATIDWDKNGLLTSFSEKDSYSNYRGYSGVNIEESFTITYSK